MNNIFDFCIKMEFVMKNKLILSMLMVGALLQPNITYSAQDFMTSASSTAQGFMDKFLAWWNSSAPSITEKASEHQFELIVGGSVAAGIGLGIYLIKLTNRWDAERAVALKEKNLIKQQMIIEANKKQIIGKIKYYLIRILGNELLYPTPSSMLDALSKKDILLNGIIPFVKNDIKDVRAFFDEACNQLSSGIREQMSELDEEAAKQNELSRQFSELEGLSETVKNKKNNDTIDKHIAAYELGIANIQSLEDKIEAFRQGEYQSRDILQTRAYMSVYYRLVNELAIERALKAKAEEIARVAEEKEVSFAPTVRDY